jgi:hypothetical protein
MKNYREMYELKCCYYCAYYKETWNSIECKHTDNNSNKEISPVGTCDNWREEEFGN